jgi:hypothetical protein
VPRNVVRAVIWAPGRIGEDRDHRYHGHHAYD